MESEKPRALMITAAFYTLLEDTARRRELPELETGELVEACINLSLPLSDSFAAF